MRCIMVTAENVLLKNVSEQMKSCVPTQNIKDKKVHV